MWFGVVALCILFSLGAASDVYEGITCRPNSMLPLSDRSKLPKIFTSITQPCAMWQTGRFLSPEEPFAYGTIKSCHNYTSGYFFQGKWTNDCGVRWLQPEELRSALQGKSFVFEGDSMVRQLFLRLIFYVRGIPEMVEHPFHSDAVYALNGTHDIFTVGAMFHPDELLNPTFIAQFDWNPGVENYPPPFSNYTLRVFGFHYWINDATFLQRVLKFGDDKRDLHMTTPPTEQSFDAKNRWVSQKPHLPLETMFHSQVFRRNVEDNMHFGCTFLSLTAQQLTGGTIRAPLTGDCRDMINLNMIQMMMHFIYNGTKTTI